MIKCLELSMFLGKPHYHGPTKPCFISYYEIDCQIVWDASSDTRHPELLTQ